MTKHTILLTVVFILIILERLYLFPIYIPLDTKPSGIRSATYLAKSIAHSANADIEICCMDMEQENNATMFYFSASIDKSNFNINVFLDKDLMNVFLKNQQRNKNDKYYNPCFVKGKYYVVCEAIVGRSKRNISPAHGQKYYNQFPGETIEYTKN